MSMQGDLLNEIKQEKLFAILLKREENLICADCQTKAPTWVSLDFGVFVCMNCSGAHRHLSRSVTRVYSTKIDRWNHQNYQIMDYVGNGVANLYWEFKKPTRRIAFNAQPDERVRFITEKYVRKLYTNSKAQNPVLVFLKNREKGILERPILHNEEQVLQVPPINIDGKKQYISNGAATNEHRIQVNKEQKEICKKEKFNSVTSPSSKPMTDLIDLDDDYYKLDNEDKFTNFQSAPQQQQQQQQQQPQQQQQQQQQIQSTQSQQSAQININRSSILDLYNQKSNSAPVTGHHPVNGHNGSNLNALYQNGQSYTNSYGQNYGHQHTSNQAGQNNHNNNYAQYNGNNSLNKPSQPYSMNQTQNTSSGVVNSSQTASQPSTQNTNVDLMSLYSQSNTQNNNIISVPTAALQQQQQQQPMLHATNNNNAASVDKNRFQALNQMGQYNNNSYYPYYQMQQGFQGYNNNNQGGLGNHANYQNNQQWK